ncbi:MAG: hypothetical protein O7D86_00090, partial [Proteobacteria bacterium]|nr:hypothetical protein [Pseudomonadota bacterium]
LTLSSIVMVCPLTDLSCAFMVVGLFVWIGKRYLIINKRKHQVAGTPSVNASLLINYYPMA